MEDWSEKQLNAIRSLARGKPKVEVAIEIGIARSTLYEWLKQPDFNEAVRQLRLSYRQESSVGLYLLTADAIDCLRVLIKDDEVPPYVRCQASLGVVEAARKTYTEEELERRVQELESRLEDALARIQARQD